MNNQSWSHITSACYRLRDARDAEKMKSKFVNLEAIVKSWILDKYLEKRKKWKQCSCESIQIDIDWSQMHRVRDDATYPDIPDISHGDEAHDDINTQPPAETGNRKELQPMVCLYLCFLLSFVYESSYRKFQARF